MSLSPPDLAIAINGLALDTEYNRLNVDGAVDLLLSGSYVPQRGDAFTIFAGSSVTGQFDGLADGDVIVRNGADMLLQYHADRVTLKAPPHAPASPMPLRPSGVVQFKRHISNAVP